MQESTERIIGGLFLIVVILLVFNIIYREPISEEQLQKRYEGYMKKNLNDKTSLYFSNLCRETENRVDCVMTETKDKTSYVKDSERNTPKKPTQYLLEGGDCKDSATFYATIFKNLGYDVKFRFPIPNHVAITISEQTGYDDWRYCDIESQTYTCYEVKI